MRAWQPGKAPAMAVYKDPRSSSWVVKVRNFSGTQTARFVTPENLKVAGIPVPSKIGKATARALEGALLRTVGKQQDAAKGAKRIMLSEAAERYIAARSVGSSQIYRERYIIVHAFTPFLGDRPMDSISIEDVERFKASVTPGHSAVTVRGYVHDLRRFFTWCVRVGILREDPSRGIPLPRRRIFDIEYLQPEQAAALVAAVKSEAIEGPVLACLNLGLRFGELPRLRWEDADFARGIVLVRGTKSRSALRAVPLPKSFGEYLSGIPRRGQYIFPGADGEAAAKSMFESSRRRFADRVKLDFHWTWQTLRRTYGSILVLRGVPLEYVSRYLGHEDVRVTQMWYIGLRSMDFADKVSEALKGMA